MVDWEAYDHGRGWDIVVSIHQRNFNTQKSTVYDGLANKSKSPLCIFLKDQNHISTHLLRVASQHYLSLTMPLASRILNHSPSPRTGTGITREKLTEDNIML